MSDFQRYLEEQLKDPVFTAEWEKQRPEREKTKAIMAVRIEQNNYQKSCQEEQVL